MKNLFCVFIVVFICHEKSFAQVSYGSATSFSLRKVKPGYTGSSVQVRRTCDNAVGDIGFNSCGDLDTNALKTFVVAANPLSSISSLVEAAYGLRRLKCSYAGNAIQVRRSSDNTTLNIGFNSIGDLDTVSLKAFVTVNNAFITTWYDQSGNGYNLTQTVTANQPRIMLSGIIDKQNNRPAIYYDGLANYLQNNAYTLLLNNLSSTWNAIFSPVATNNAFASIISWRSGGQASQLEVGPSNNWNTSWWSNTNWSTTNGLTVINGSYQILTALTNATSTQMYFNGGLSFNNTGQSNIAAIAGNPVGGNVTPLIIGNDFCCAGRYIKGYLPEVILSSGYFSATDRQFLEWSQAQYYNISGPALTTLPATPPSGYISVWYDQSGAGLNATQTSTVNQPRIISAGIIEKSGTKSAIKFLGSPTTLTLTTPVSSYPVSISCLANTGGLTTNGAFVKLGGINLGSAGIGIGVGAALTNYDISGFSILGLKEWQVWCPSTPVVNFPSTPFVTTETQQSSGGGSGMAVFLNGTNIPLLLPNNITDGNTITGLLSIGGYANITLRYPVVKQTEVHIFGSALNTTRRTLLETNQSSHYNITISNSKYTPPSPTAYNLFVNGVGRETSTDSVAGTRASVGMGFLIGTSAIDFLKDNGDYITAGINCPIVAATSTLNLVAPVITRWYNDWYVNKTDISSNNGNVTFYFNFSDYGIGVSPGVAANYRLLNRINTASNFAVVPGVTITVIGNRVQFLVDGSNIPTNYYYTIGTTNDVTSPLPVDLTDFNALKAERKVNVSWTTISEKNNDYFTVQRSQNAIDFTDLGNVKAAGNSNSEKKYLFVDTKPLSKTSYYRLKQTDLDKSFTFSKLVQVNFEEESVPNLYPNPTTGILKLTNCKTYQKILVMDASGRSVYSTEIKQDNMIIDLSILPAGEYLLIMHNISDQNRFSSKIVIEK